MRDEDHIEIYTGVVSNTELDLQKDKLNYTAITSTTTELYKLDLTQFMQIIVGQPLQSFHKSLQNIQTDSAYRQAYLSKKDWAKSQRDYVLQFKQNSVQYKLA